MSDQILMNDPLASEIPIRRPEELGALIAAARRRQCRTQREVADALGVTQAWISRVENGRERAWIGQILRLAACLELDLFARMPAGADRPEVAPASGTSFFPEHDDWVD